MDRMPKSFPMMLITQRLERWKTSRLLARPKKECFHSPQKRDSDIAGWEAWVGIEPTHKVFQF